MVHCPNCGKGERNPRQYIDMSLRGGISSPLYNFKYFPQKKGTIRFLVLYFVCSCQRVKLDLVLNKDNSVSDRKVQSVLNKEWKEENSGIRRKLPCRKKGKYFNKENYPDNWRWREK